MLVLLPLWPGPGARGDGPCSQGISCCGRLFFASSQLQHCKCGTVQYSTVLFCLVANRASPLTQRHK